MFLFITLVSQAPAQTVTLAWDQNLEPDVAGYKIYYRTDTPTFPFKGTTLSEGASPILVEGSATTALTLNLPEDGSIYYFTATAINSSQTESSYSDIIATEWIPFLLAPTDNNAVGTTATFAWEQAPYSYNVSFELIYGTNPELNTNSLATVAPVTFNSNWPDFNLTPALPLATLLAFLMLASIGQAKHIWRPVRFGLCIGIIVLQASCGGGGGGGDTGIVSDTSVPVTSVPVTAVPVTAVPDTSIPDTSIPDTSIPDTSIPDTSIPDTSVPDGTVIDSAASTFTNVISDINATEYQISGLLPETQYYWKIVAVDNWGNRFESLTQEFTTLTQ